MCSPENGTCILHNDNQAYNPYSTLHLTAESEVAWAETEEASTRTETFMQDGFAMA